MFAHRSNWTVLRAATSYTALSNVTVHEPMVQCWHTPIHALFHDQSRFCQTTYQSSYDLTIFVFAQRTQSTTKTKKMISINRLQDYNYQINLSSKKGENAAMGKSKTAPLLIVLLALYKLPTCTKYFVGFRHFAKGENLIEYFLFA